jgi:phage terminase large subunit-like protein
MKKTKDGLMVESTLRTVLGNFVKIQSVRATKNKVIRWEPVYALYEKQKIKHLRKIYRFRVSIINF